MPFGTLTFCSFYKPIISIFTVAQKGHPSLQFFKVTFVNLQFFNVNYTFANMHFINQALLQTCSLSIRHFCKLAVYQFAFSTPTCSIAKI